MPTWAPITKKIIDKGFGGSRNGQPITGAVVHHGAGTDVLGYVANANSRTSHPTYHIANDGTVTGIVHPDRRPYSTGHSVDVNAITFEIDNETGAPEWRVSAAALESLAQVLAHHAKESPRQDRAEINEPSRTQSGFWVGWHAQYVATACPGPFVIPRMPSIVDRVNTILGGSTAPANQHSAPAGGVSIGGSTVGYMYETIDGQRVERNVAAAFRKLAAAFKAKFGLTLHVTSGTRTRAEQQALYDAYRSGRGNLAAPPGQSNHEETGPRGPRALDVRDSGGDPGVTRAGTVRANWLRQNAPAYGFDPAGYRFSRVEPWHIEFTGAIGGGAADQDTKNRQSWLNEARGEKLAVDGIQGPATTAAIKRYQNFLNERYGTKLAVDGIWGTETQNVHQRYWDELKKPKPAPNPQPAQKRPDPWSVVKGWNWNGIAAMLRRYHGYRGNNVPGPQMVSALQRFLKANYGYTGAIDGIFGDGTAAAVQRWLKAKYGYAGAIDAWMGGGTHEAWKRAEVANWNASPQWRQ